MGVKNQVEKKKKAQVEEENESESESELEFEYNDADSDNDDDEEGSSEEESDSDDPETEDSESEEPDTTTTPTPRRQKRKNLKMSRFAGSSEDEANDASGEDDDNAEINGDDTPEQPRKKKRKKMSKLDKTTDDSEDDAESDEEGEEASGDDDDSDDESEEEEEEKEEEEEEEVKAHKGFADALSNILSKKTVSSKKVILALGKTDKEIKKLKDSKLPPEEQETKEPYLTPQELEEKKMKRKLWLEMSKVKPNVLERNRERELKMIATRGVVQLFNAVKKQQKMVNDSLSGAHSERKKEMVIESMNKKSFINLLQNTKVDTSMGTAEKETPMKKEPERKIWSVLKDDFVIGTGKMKDWDKQDDMEDL